MVGSIISYWLRWLLLSFIYSLLTVNCYLFLFQIWIFKKLDCCPPFCLSYNYYSSSRIVIKRWLISAGHSLRYLDWMAVLNSRSVCVLSSTTVSFWAVADLLKPSRALHLFLWGNKLDPIATYWCFYCLLVQRRCKRKYGPLFMGAWFMSQVLCCS